MIVRSYGRPASNVAVVIDDSQMKVTHVIRGEDHLSNTPRQVLLYEALNATPPAFAHLSMVLGPDHAPLSKRQGDTSVAEFRERGFLPEALVNYLALLGWSPGDGEELLPIAEMSRRFDLSRVGHSSAVFDVGKLAWMNRHYMKDAPAARIVRDSLKYFVRAGFVTHGTDAALAYLESILGMAVGSVDRLEEIPDRVAFIFDWDVSRAAGLVRAEPDGARAVQAFAAEIAGAGPLDRDAFRAAATRAREQTALKGRALFHPAIDRAAALPAGSGLASIAACKERARLVAKAVG